MESVGNIIMYFIIALAIIVFSVLTVTSDRILRSATYLFFVLLATAGIYFQLDYEFLGAVQIAVYAGGIMVLIVFAVLLTHHPEDKLDTMSAGKRALGVLAALAGVALCGYALVSEGSLVLSEMGVMDLDMDKIGQTLLSSDKWGYLLPFEAVSVLLLACIIGGITIARKR